MNAIIITGQYRSFDNIFESIVKNIIEPNNCIVFICIEGTCKIQDILNRYPSVKIGNIIVESTFRNIEFQSILHMIRNSNRPGLSPEVFERSRRADGINWQYSYVEQSGTILQYYQFWRIWQKVLEYERKNSIKFDNVMRTRTDIYLSKPINISIVFDGYIRELYSSQKLVESSKYFDDIVDDINHSTVVTLGEEQVWISRRDNFNMLSQLIFHYGLYDSGFPFAFNSETQFHQFCKHHNLKHIGIKEKDWPMYSSSLEQAEKYLFVIARF
jgi:hypothetical protein